MSILGMASKDINKVKKEKKKLKNKKQNQNIDPETGEPVQTVQSTEKVASIKAKALKALAIKGNIDQAKNVVTQTNHGSKRTEAIREGKVPLKERNKKSKYSTSLEQKQPRKTAKVPKPPAPPKVASLVRGIHRDMLEIEKDASSFSATAKDMRDTLGKGLAMGGGIAAASAAVSGGIYGANKLHKNIKTENMWKELKNRRPDLTKTRKDRENFGVLKQFSPDVASNITTLESYMERMKHQMMTPHEFVGDLTKIQKDRSSLSRVDDFAESTGKTVGGGIQMAMQNRYGNKDNK
jgi:hypothetical protein